MESLSKEKQLSVQDAAKITSFSLGIGYASVPGQKEPEKTTSTGHFNNIYFF